jgi:NADP-dependent 3-hydroxy acid dehydrogenase YdfG
VDIWISNAGVAHPQQNIWEMAHDEAEKIIQANLVGMLNNMRVAINGMMEQGFGQLYTMEGFGSNGKVRKGLGVYGSTKSAIAFLNKTLAAELEGQPVKIASVQPGMVITDLVIDQFHSPEDLERVKPIFNIVASSVDEVCPKLVDKMLQEHKNGAHIAFMNRFDYFMRFLSAPFKKRNLFEDS